MHLKTFQIFFLLILCNPFALQANNIQPSNAKVVRQGTTNDTAVVQFDLNWEDSWRTTSAPNNWDAAWVFVKFRMGKSDPTFTGVSSSGTTVTASSTANGAGNRGGSYDGWQADLRISDRSFADNSATKRTKSDGCRAVRTAP